MVLFQASAKNYQPADQTFDAPSPLDSAVSEIQLTLTRENWAQVDPIATVRIEFSLDGGVTWNGASSTLPGGEITRHGVVIVDQVLRGSVPNVGQAGRLVRGHVQTFSTLRTAVTVEAF